MGREIIMVGICTLAVIGLAWLMDHPKKELGSLIALGAFGVMVLVAYLKSKDQVRRHSSRLIVNKHRADQGDDTSADGEKE
ncbi:MAG: hypothetical protein ACO36I_21350 [Candidatus Latescibacterota bacterium]|jgi:hypothetical protein